MLLKLVVLAVCLTSAFAFPDGAPTAACTNLIPGHGSELPFDLPLNVEFSTTSLTSGSLLTVTLRSVHGTVFGDFFYRGFMLQGRIQDGTNRVVGFFETGPGVRHVTCPQLYPESSVTHTAHNDREVVTVNWRAPTNIGASPIQVVFHYTIVMNVGLFWADQRTIPITILPH